MEDCTVINYGNAIYCGVSLSKPWHIAWGLQLTQTCHGQQSLKVLWWSCLCGWITWCEHLMSTSLICCSLAALFPGISVASLSWCEVVCWEAARAARHALSHVLRLVSLCCLCCAPLVAEFFNNNFEKNISHLLTCHFDTLLVVCGSPFLHVSCHAKYELQVIYTYSTMYVQTDRWTDTTHVLHLCVGQQDEKKKNPEWRMSVG